MIRKMLLVDDHPLVLSALQGMVAAIDPSVSVVLAEDAGQAQDRLREHDDVELVLLDLTLADAEGVQALARIRADHPLLPVVVLSATDRMPDVVAALDLGAMGFISKRTGHAELAHALALVMAGGVYVPMAMQAQLAGLSAGLTAGLSAGVSGPTTSSRPLPGATADGVRSAADRAASLSPGQAAAAALAALQQGGQASSGLAGVARIADEAAAEAGSGAVDGALAGVPTAAPVAAPAGTAAAVTLPTGELLTGLPLAAQFAALGLTPRQSDVLGLLLRGLSNKLIARELSLSVETVKDHVAAVLRALGVNSRTQAVLAVSRLTRPGVAMVAAPGQTAAALPVEIRRDPL